MKISIRTTVLYLAAGLTSLALDASAEPQRTASAMPPYTFEKFSFLDPTGLCHYGSCWRSEESLDLADGGKLLAKREAECAKNGYWCDWIGRRYELGDGVALDLERAIHYYERSCPTVASLDRASNCAPLSLLGRRFATGDGLERSASRAVTLYERACPGPGGRACMWAGETYRDGLLTQKDPAKAADYFARACGARPDACAAFTALEIEQGSPIELPKAASSREIDNWVDVTWLESRCSSTYSTSIALSCRVLGMRELHGLRTRRDPDLARVHLSRACALRDGVACDVLAELPSLTYEGSDLRQPGVRERACLAGDRESCWHVDLSACWGDRPLSSNQGRRVTTVWSSCAQSRSRCASGEILGCRDLAKSGAVSIEGSREAAERAMSLARAACKAGDSKGCFTAVSLYGDDFSGGRFAMQGKDSMLAFALATEEGVCRAGDVETCWRLADRYRQSGEAEKSDSVLKAAANVDKPPCAAGEFSSCDRLAKTYQYHLKETSKAIRVWDGACRRGVGSACERRARYNGHGDFGVLPAAGLGWNSALGLTGTASVAFGAHHDIPAVSCALTTPASNSVRGLILQAEAGEKGGKLSAGWGVVNYSPAPPFVSGIALKASYLKGWGATLKGTEYAGVEVQLSLLGLRITGGHFEGVRGTRDRMFTWGIGAGF